MIREPVFAPREIFEQMLEYMVIPTLDLVISYGSEGIIIVRRKISPYKGVWALPGLRMHKGENIDDALERIAYCELGLNICVNKKILVGQYVGKFKSEKERHDLSTCYLVYAPSNQNIKLNQDHFTSFRVTSTIPRNTGAMYRYYLNEYFTKFQGNLWNE